MKCHNCSALMVEYINADDSFDSLYICLNEAHEQIVVWNKSEHNTLPLFGKDEEPMMFNDGYFRANLTEMQDQEINEAIKGNVEKGLMEEIKKDGNTFYRLTQAGVEYMNSLLETDD